MHRQRTRPRPGRAVPLALLALVVPALALGLPGRVVASPRGPLPPPPPPQTTSGPPSYGRPNVVLILTDDQRASTLSSMPNVAALLGDKGTTYNNAMVPTSLCCPSRSTILTGLYAHTSRLYGNGDVGGKRYGGWPRFHALGLERRTMGPALHAAGYRTALIGKYLNYFGKFSPPGYTPPGWDTFSTFMSNHGSYFHYRLNDGTYHAGEPEDYSTDVFAGEATDFIASTPADQPLFLYFAPFGPHAPYVPAPRHFGALDGKLTSYTAATLHQPLRAMPRWMQLRKHFSQADVDLTRERQLETLMSVDEAVGSIVRTLAETGREQDTLFLFMSDNGYFWGEHRIIGKDAPYWQATAIPMVLRWDGHVAAGVTSSRMVLNVDVARTIAVASGARMRTDGLNILGPRKRTGFVLEAMNGYNNRPAYCGYRTRHRMFVHWDTGEEELYDYRSDPQEAHNLVHRKAWRAVRAAMRAKAHAACSPLPPHFHWKVA